MGSVKKGIVFVIVSAFIFGFTPVLTRITYDEGTNGVTMTFLRSALAVPFLFIIMKIRKIPFAVTRAEARDLLLAGLAFSVTVIMMYSSYAYIPVGEAVTLHFIYPVFVSLGCVLFYREKLTKTTLTALILGIAGVFLFSENMSFDNVRSGAAAGFLLALASGLTFTFYMICVDKSSLRRIPATKITLILCVMGALCSGIYGEMCLGGLALGMTLKGWACAWVVALSVSLAAVGLLQLGIKYTGATTAAILSTFEPITGVLCGALFLGEKLSLPKMAGCACIIVSVVLVTAAVNGTKNQPVSS